MAEKGWSVEMKGEKSSGGCSLPDGEYQAEITDVKLISKEESKSGNPYFKWFFQTPDGPMEAITTLLKGKRWLLKQTLSACGIEAADGDADEKYTFSLKDVVGKTVVIKIQNKPNSFTGQDGSTITNTKSEVKQVRALKEEGETTIPF